MKGKKKVLTHAHTQGMHLRILPDSLWVAYTVTQPAALQQLLPPSLELARPKVFQDEAALVQSPKLLFNLYEVDGGPWMRGTRLEVVTVGRHRQTGKYHFCVLDCLTNTLQWDPVEGISGPNARVVSRRSRRSRYSQRPMQRRRDPEFHTRVSDTFLAEMRTSSHRFRVEAFLGEPRPISSRFAVEANRACYFSNVDVPYPMQFSETEVCQPVVTLLPKSPIVNTLWSSWRSPYPSHACFHPHAMHYVVKDVPVG